MEKFAYIIGFRWPENGEIGAYAIHSQTVFNGTTEDAKNTLDYVKAKDKECEYKIYKLV